MELGGMPLVQEEIRGHHHGNVPKSHLVVLFLGHHLPEEFQECLGKKTELALKPSTSLVPPTFPEHPHGSRRY
jgi:hypothetical protein